MQQHRTNKSRRFGRKANANYPVSSAAESSVYGVVDSIDGGEDFAYAYLREEFRSKYCDETLTPAFERRTNAIRKFRDCEKANAGTNERFRSLDPEFNVLNRVTFKSFLRFARRFARDILGPLRDEVVLGSFSGGASTSRPRTSSHPAEKFVGKADITEGAMCVLDVLHRLAPLLRQYGTFNDLQVVPGSVLFTVPKKTDIDRCACKEPDINMFLQKGVGAHIRRRLRRFGINLNDQSRNRSLAHLGSIDESLCTLDLSSASDTISYEVVRALLPDDWFAYLDSIRSHVVRIDDEEHRMEMFSSMGNGFTFELESMIFFVLCRSTAYFMNTPGVISVYGDDIIAPSELFDDLIFVLKQFGFAVNKDKSFAVGSFRESCGGHYMKGEDVTPFYLKRRPTHLTDVIRVANQLRRWAFADPFRRYLMPQLYHVWYELASHIPRDLWGGSDYSVDTQLVAPCPPRNRLVRVTGEKKLSQLGAYLLWQNSCWNRADAAEAAFEPVSTNQICRKRRAPSGAALCQEYFLQELL